MALDLDRLEEDILDALMINLSEDDKIPPVVEALEATAAALSTAIDTYVRDATIRVSGVDSGNSTRTGTIQ